MEANDTPHKVGHREACWNSRSGRGAVYRAQNGWTLNRTCEGVSPNFVWIEDRMSQPCGQRKGMNPPGCEGCEELGE